MEVYDGNQRQQGDGIRSPAISYQEVLDQEKGVVPECLRVESNPYMGSHDLSTDRYYGEEFHELEVKNLWPRVWQMACREEDIPRVGDCLVYDITKYSILIVRVSEDRIKAYHNVCLHRGRQLVDQRCRVGRIRCKFHGFTWSLEGEYKSNPCPWDFPHIDPEKKRLPEVRIGRWGGFVFINMDPESISLEEFWGVLPSHFERWPLDKHFKAVHVLRRLPCNWKIAHEAFIESMHAFETHPHLAPYIADTNSQYDTFGDNISRTITVTGLPSPLLEKSLSEQKTLELLLAGSGRLSVDESAKLTLQKGQTAREFMAEANRKAIEDLTGEDHSRATHSELLDAILYSVFPNTSPWAGFNGNIVYRFRPHGNSPSQCTMEVMILCRYKGKRPPAASIINIPDDALFSSIPELGALGPVFDQDLGNLPFIQKGLMASATGKISLANYNESRIRHFHRTLDKYIYGRAKENDRRPGGVKADYSSIAYT